MIKLIDVIRNLEESGILARESCPTQHYWHWLVLRPNDLPHFLKAQYECYGEIRWYGSDVVVIED